MKTESGEKTQIEIVIGKQGKFSANICPFLLSLHDERASFDANKRKVEKELTTMATTTRENERERERQTKGDKCAMCVHTIDEIMNVLCLHFLLAFSHNFLFGSGSLLFNRKTVFFGCVPSKRMSTYERLLRQKLTSKNIK